MSLRTPLSAAKGLGSAKEGTHHWWMQRLTSIGLVPLTIWLALSIAMLPHIDYAAVHAWMASPVSCVLLVLTMVAMLFHLNLGVQVIIEDYVHVHWLKMTSIIALNFSCIILGIIGLYSLLKVAF